MKESFQLKVDDERIIRGDVFRSNPSLRGTLIMAHGYKGFKDWGMFPHAAEQLSDTLNVMNINFSMNGVGEDPMEFTELEKFAGNTYSRELEDLGTLVTAIKQGDFEVSGIEADEPIYLLGHSRGGAVSLIYAFDYPNHIDGVVSWNGITNVDIFPEQQKQEMREKGRSYVLNGRTQQQMPLDVEILEDMAANAERFNIMERAKIGELPIALIQGTEDSPHYRKGSEQLTRLNDNIQLLEVNEGNHTFGAVHPFKGETEQLAEAIRLTKQVLSEWHKDN
jgi:predicted esterase